MVGPWEGVKFTSSDKFVQGLSRLVVDFFVCTCPKECCEKNVLPLRQIDHLIIFPVNIDQLDNVELYFNFREHSI